MTKNQLCGFCAYYIGAQSQAIIGGENLQECKALRNVIDKLLVNFPE